MKQLLTVLSFLFGVFTAQAQKEYILSFDTTYENKSIPVPFRGVRVVDARFDRSKIGVGHTQMGNLFNKFQKNDIHFPDSLQNYLPYLFNSLFVYNATSEDSLIVLIKKFRLSETLGSSVKGGLGSNLILTLSASFYLSQKGMLKKLHSVDGTQILKAQSTYYEDIRLNDENGIAVLLRAAFYKLIQSTNWNAPAQQSSFSYKEMEAAVQKRFNLPVFTQTPPVGLFKTISEFKNATPSITNITVVYDKNRVDKVINANSTLVNLADYWGLYDGKKYYYFFRGEMAEMKPTDRSFQVLSFRTRAELRGKATGTELSDGALFKDGAIFRSIGNGARVEEYFDLDMDTGELFLEEIFGKSGVKSMQKELLR